MFERERERRERKRERERVSKHLIRPLSHIFLFLKRAECVGEQKSSKRAIFFAKGRRRRKMGGKNELAWLEKRNPLNQQTHVKPERRRHRQW